MARISFGIDRPRRPRCSAPDTARSSREKRRGAALLELAIILPLLLTIVFGCVDFGRFAYTAIALGNAAREATYLASTTPITSDSEQTHAIWEQAVRDVAAREMSDVPGFDPQQLEVTVPAFVRENARAQHVSVTVSYPFRTLVPFPRMDAAITLQRTVVMRMIR